MILIKKLLALVILCTAFSVASGAHPAYAAPPASFDKLKVIDGLTEPTSFRFAPNGDILIAERAGNIRVVHNGVLQPTPLLTLNSLTDHQKGLWGFDLGHNYSTNGYIFVSYVKPSDGLQRLARFTVSNGVANPSTELLVHPTRDPVTNNAHNGNDVEAGPDGMMWWSVGDNLIPDHQQSDNSIHGKINRFQEGGGHATDNVWFGLPDKEEAIWALGLRNPFRFTFLPNKVPLSTDQGNEYQEFNVIAKAGNYGAPLYEGTCANCGMANPVYSYKSSNPNTPALLTALTVYQNALFPASYNGVVFYGDYGLKKIGYLTFDSAYQTVQSDTTFDTNADSVIDMHQGPDGALYYLSFEQGTLYKYVPANGNRTPVALATANKTSGLAPLAVNFFSTGSQDPDGQSLSYSWNFGDGATSNLANPSHSYPNNGTYLVTLTVSDGNKSNTVPLSVTVGNRAPTATITSPVSGTTYAGNTTITFTGTATDPDEGSLPDTAYSWKVMYHNGNQSLSYLGPIANVHTGNFTIASDTTNSPTSWFTVQLTVKDSGGLSTMVSQDIHPQTVSTQLQTNVTNGQYTFDGRLYSSPIALSTVPGIQYFLNSISPQIVGGKSYRFQSWNDGGNLAHTITIPTTNSTQQLSLLAVQPLTSPWQTTDVGTPKFVGSGEATDTGFLLTGAGDDIWGSKDTFRYVYQPLVGDGSIVARIISQTNTNGSAKAGVMFKQSVASQSAYVMVGITPENGYKFQWNFDQSVGGGSYSLPNAWVKLQRVGNSFTAFKSADGTTWTRIGNTVTVAMNGPITMGLFDTSHNNGAISTVVFDHVTTEPVSSPAPTPSPSPSPLPTPSPSPTPTPTPSPSPSPGTLPGSWNQIDLDNPGVVGAGSFSNNIFTNSGSGADIWDTHDQFHYIYQNIGGDSTIIAKVSSQTNTNASAKAGVMIKESATAFAPYTLLATTPGNGTKFQWNFAKQSQTGPGLALPNAWLKLQRRGNSFSAFTSPDGTTWTKLGSSQTVTMGNLVTIGLAVTSHNNSVLSSASFENVSVTQP